MFEGELERALGRGRYQRAGRVTGYRNGHRERGLLGTFGPVTLPVPRARLFDAEGGDRAWKNQTLPAFKRRTKRGEAVIASSYLAGVNTRRVRRALESLFGGVIGAG